MGISNKIDNRSSFKRDRRYDTSTSFQEVPRLFNQDGNTRKKRSDSGEVSTHSHSEAKLPDNAPIMLTWVPKERGRSLPDGEALYDPDISKTLKTYDYYKIIVDHIKTGETRKIYICLNGPGLEHEQITEIEQRFNNELESLGLSNKIQQIKVVNLHSFDWSSINHGWKIDGEDIDIKEYYKSDMYDPAKAQGRMSFPTEIDTFRIIILALSEQITGKRGAIYVDFDTLGLTKEPLGRDITIPDGILVREVNIEERSTLALDQKDISVRIDMIVINDPNVAVEILSRFKGIIKSEAKLYDDIKSQVLVKFPGFVTQSRSTDELLTEYGKKGGAVLKLIVHTEGGKQFIIANDSLGDYITEKILGKVSIRIDEIKGELKEKFVKLRSDLGIGVLEEDANGMQNEIRSKNELKRLPLQGWSKSEVINLNLKDWTMDELASMLPDTDPGIKEFKLELEEKLSYAFESATACMRFRNNGGKSPNYLFMTHHYSWIRIPSLRVGGAIEMLKDSVGLDGKKASTQLEEISRYVRQNGITGFDSYLEALSKKIRGFLNDKKREAFIELEKISEQIKDFYKQGQITRNKEALKTKIKKLIKDFRDNDIGINTPSSEGETLLHLATRIDDESLVSNLLNKGAVFNVRNKGNLTPKDLSKSEEVLTLFTNAEQAFYTLH